MPCRFAVITGCAWCVAHADRISADVLPPRAYQRQQAGPARLTKQNPERKLKLRIMDVRNVQRRDSNIILATFHSVFSKYVHHIYIMKFWTIRLLSP